MLLYMESPHTVDLGRLEMIFRILSSLLISNRGAALGKMMVHCMVFNNTSTSPQSAGGGVNQLVEYLNRHYKAIQGEDFRLKSDALAEGSKPRHCSFFELFSAISLHYLRSKEFDHISLILQYHLLVKMILQLHGLQNCCT
uniref:Uncharacterized protein n=1 Tax=Panagrolaimus sp. ES5 TaxID=591445 RepID=A0AC34GK88_9BILA